MKAPRRPGASPDAVEALAIRVFPGQSDRVGKPKHGLGWFVALPGHHSLGSVHVGKRKSQLAAGCLGLNPRLDGLSCLPVPIGRQRGLHLGLLAKTHQADSQARKSRHHQQADHRQRSCHPWMVPIPPGQSLKP